MDTSVKPKFILKIVRETARDYAVSAVVGLVVLLLLPWWLRCASVYLIALVFLTNVIGPFLIDFKPRRRLSSSQKAVIISGCDSGFGHNLALSLEKDGYRVFAGCLFPNGKGAQDLQKVESDRLHVFSLDVTNDQSISDAIGYVNDNLKGCVLWAVVSNAGINDGAELMWTSNKTIQRVLDVNTFGVVKVTKAFLPQICASKGRIVAVASSAGRCSYPGMVPYCMSKQATVGFCEGLRLEMYRWGVKVVTIEPWMYRTAITNEDSIKEYISRTWSKAPEAIRNMYPSGYLDKYIEATKKILYFSIASDPGEVVKCLEEAVSAENPKYSYNPGTLYSRLSFWITSRLPKSITDFLIFLTFSPRLSRKDKAL